MLGTTQAIVRDVVYGMFPVLLRAKQHHALAECLEADVLANPKKSGIPSQVIAFHWHQACQGGATPDVQIMLKVSQQSFDDTYGVIHIMCLRDVHPVTFPLGRHLHLSTKHACLLLYMHYTM
jgi:hypothetical protein